jgi:hypothetical protein
MRRRYASLNTTVWSMHSRRIEPISRSTWPFCQGDRAGGRTIADSHRTNAARICWAECRVAVADQVAWRFIPGESLSHLSGDPFGARMSGDAEPYQPPTLMAQDHQHIEQFEKRGRHHEEIDRSNACRMVAQEGLPAL